MSVQNAEVQDGIDQDKLDQYLEAGNEFIRREDYAKAFKCFQAVLIVDKNDRRACDAISKLFQVYKYVPTEEEQHFIIDFFISTVDENQLKAAEQTLKAAQEKNRELKANLEYVERVVKRSDSGYRH